MIIEFLKAGLQTSIQDKGRQKFRKFGIPQSGAIDFTSLTLANWLVGNEGDIAGLEIYLIGPTIKFHDDIAIGIAGAQFEVFINDVLVDTQSTLFLNCGDILRFGKLLSGARAYIAFSRKIVEEDAFASLSIDTTSKLGPNQGMAFRSGDHLVLTQNNPHPITKSLNAEIITHYSNNLTLRVTPANDFKALTEASQSLLYSSQYAVSSNSNRMGIRLKGNTLKLNKEKELISSPITVGTVQLPPDGNPIIVLNEGQTIGGYPKVAQVISADLALMGQLPPHSKVSFYPVNINKALFLASKKHQYITQYLNYDPSNNPSISL